MILPYKFRYSTTRINLSRPEMGQKSYFYRLPKFEGGGGGGGGGGGTKYGTPRYTCTGHTLVLHINVDSFCKEAPTSLFTDSIVVNN
eukprot:SAG11_NODE_275_length_11309_cov_6.090901_4_plen_87_part_00